MSKGKLKLCKKYKEKVLFFYTSGQEKIHWLVGSKYKRHIFKWSRHTHLYLHWNHHCGVPTWCCCSVAQLCLTPWTAPCQASLSFTISQSLLKLMPIESVTPSNHPILCRPLFFLPSIFTSIRIFSNELTLHIRWPKYWTFSFSISPSSEYSGLISFRIDLLAVQGTLKSLLQHHSSKASVHQLSDFYCPALTSIHD